ncbi:unnamed protein product [Caenorhabditis nigoni]|uniref:Uncharacterized protein n=1 Tax=Caenorhabditis nigoni TaxID=1611254 RepID=A0A2G5SMN4_9PELO|nr:hypothetical protein B9Z55_022821 [Caenorhabditis nigoni]
MAYLFGLGDGILIALGIILVAVSLCIVNRRSKELSSILNYVFIATLLLLLLYWWPVKNVNEPPIDEQIKTDIILIPRIVFFIFLPFFLIYLINLYVRHDLFNIVRAQSTASRHAKPWLIEAKIRSRRDGGKSK